MKKHIILIAIALLFIGKAVAQQNFNKVDAWLNDNTPAMGGRSVLVVYKDGKVVYNEAVNDLSRRQKMVNKFMARRQNKTANLDDYNSASKIAIASCSKWFSAALVMTFVDEGKTKTNRYRWQISACAFSAWKGQYHH
jgi:CubicO group peptidase (beta-lactamase class C family)